MVVGELRELIADLADDVEVRLMYDEGYPKHSEVLGTICHTDLPGKEDEQEALYLVAGGTEEYGFRDAWNLCC